MAQKKQEAMRQDLEDSKNEVYSIQPMQYCFWLIVSYQEVTSLLRVPVLYFAISCLSLLLSWRV